jgi:3-oxoadipate enol-lactonase / 4-carboxymuconolactone decarboxylase
MPHITANGIRIHYRFDGPEDAPVLMLSNSLGTTLEMWDAQLPALSRDFRVLRYDTRGHGQSEVPAGEYSIEQLGRDVVGLLDALGLEQVHFCGLSIGGLTGQWLGLHAPQRLRRLIVANTAARIGNAETWNARIALVGEKGMAEVADGAVGRWFTKDYAQAEPALVAAVRRQLLQTPPAGYIGGCAAVRDADFRASLRQIRLPMLIIAGNQDPVTTTADARFIAAAVSGARLVNLPAAHLSNIEARAGFNVALLGFLDAERIERLHEDDRYTLGLQRRREVLGSAHVDRSLAGLTSFNEEFQDYITRNAWGAIWTRPGLPGHTRSLLTIAMMIALGRDAELRLHLNAARNNGVSRDEIKEVLLQSAVYCGVPAANHAFHLAQQVFAEQDGQGREG